MAKGVVGLYGVSSMEHLPVEVAITGQVKMLKGISLKPASRAD
jgi:predicted TIM-barrel enzyme